MTELELPVLERPDVDWERAEDGRPYVLPPPGVEWRTPGGRRQTRRLYTRTTTYADATSDQYQLAKWWQRRVALGLGQRPDYVRLASALTDRDDDRAALDELVGKAKEAAGPNRADEGTALHALTERIDRGESLGNPPAELLPDLAAYGELSARALRFVRRECRTVHDELGVAGTPDGIAHVIGETCPAGCGPEVLHVIDTKTGSIRYPGKMSTQLAIYARSQEYDPATGERRPWPGPVCLSWGAILHLPVEQGRAALFWLDLEHGWRGAELCGPLREWRRARPDDILRPFAAVPPIEATPDGEIREAAPRLASDKGGAPAPPPLTELPPPTELVELDDRMLADERHGELAEAGELEAPTPRPVVDWTVDRPRAAFEAAVRSADTLAMLTELAVAHREAAWMSDELRELANARWWELRGQPAREGGVTLTVVDLRGDR